MKQSIGWLVFAISSLLAFRFVAGTLEDVGSTLDEVKTRTVYQLAQEHFSAYYTTDIKEACKKLPAGVREATLFSIGKIIRDYVESPQFKLDYEKYLDETYHGSTFDPKDPRWTNSRDQKLAELTNLVSNSNPAMAQVVVSSLDMGILSKQSLLKMYTDPAMKALADQMPVTANDLSKDIEDDQVLKKLYTSDPSAFKKKYPEIMAAQQVRDEMAQEKKNSENNIQRANEEKEKRRDYRASLQLQLQEFLATSADIDFNAITKPNADGIKIFVNPAYEQKDATWKFYYRCGRESITGARKYAQGWLADLH